MLQTGRLRRIRKTVPPCRGQVIPACPVTAPCRFAIFHDTRFLHESLCRPGFSILWAANGKEHVYDFT